MQTAAVAQLDSVLDTFNKIQEELTDSDFFLQQFEVIEMQMEETEEEKEKQTKELQENDPIITQLEKTLAKAPQTYSYVLSDRIKPLILERIKKIKNFYRTRSSLMSGISAAGKATYVGFKIGQGIKEGAVAAAQGLKPLTVQGMKGMATKTAGKILASKSTWIAAAAFATVEVGLSYYDYRQGKIDWKEFKRSLKYIAGETVASVGGGALGSSIGAAIGMAFGPLGGLVGGIIGGAIGGVAGAAAVSSFRTPSTKDIVQLQTEKKSEIGNEIYMNCLEILKSKEDDTLETINTQKKKLLLAHHPDKNRDKSEVIQEACKQECIKVLQAFQLIKQHRRTEDENEIKK